jgi:hypothetical protein
MMIPSGYQWKNEMGILLLKTPALVHEVYWRGFNGGEIACLHLFWNSTWRTLLPPNGMTAHHHRMEVAEFLGETGPVAGPGSYSTLKERDLY